MVNLLSLNENILLFNIKYLLLNDKKVEDNITLISSREKTSFKDYKFTYLPYTNLNIYSRIYYISTSF